MFAISNSNNGRLKLEEGKLNVSIFGSVSTEQTVHIFLLFWWQLIVIFNSIIPLQKLTSFYV